MICPDCARAVDFVTRHPGGAGDPAASAGHRQCAARNQNRAPGQLPDCTCQHRLPRAVR